MTQDRNRDHFAQFITEDFDAYIRRKRDPHCYGNHAEIQAMSEMYNRNIEVYAYSSGGRDVMVLCGLILLSFRAY